MFKKGDKVRRINCDFGKLKVGDIKVVYDIGKDYDEIFFKGDSNAYGGHFFEKVEDNMFTKDMLVPGKHVVEFRVGVNKYLFTGQSFINGDYNHMTVERYTNDLKLTCDNDFDVMRVYELKNPMNYKSSLDKFSSTLIWQRQEKTEAEKELDELDKKIAELQEQADMIREKVQNVSK